MFFFSLYWLHSWNRALIKHDAPPHPLLTASPTLLFGNGGDHKDPMQYQWFYIIAVLHSYQKTDVKLVQKISCWHHQTPRLQFKIFLLNVFFCRGRGKHSKEPWTSGRLTTKKEIEHYWKRYIRVRLGDKTKKKTEKRLRAAQQFVYHNDRNMCYEEFTAKRKKKNKDI